MVGGEREGRSVVGRGAVVDFVKSNSTKTTLLPILLNKSYLSGDNRDVASNFFCLFVRDFDFLHAPTIQPAFCVSSRSLQNHRRAERGPSCRLQIDDFSL